MPRPKPQYKTTLTGNARGRRQWFTGKIILQVEVLVEFRHYSELKAQSWHPYKTYWRDAKESDIHLNWKIQN